MQNGSIASDDNDYWRRNLVVCVFGSLTTIVAMTLLLPFLPLYVEQLGVTGHVAISEWSEMDYGAAFFTAALIAPLWGRLRDHYGRKLMLIRASLGMAMMLLGMAQSVWQLVALRFCMRLALGGLLPCIASVIHYSVPVAKVGSHLGMCPVFLGTCLLLAIGAGFNQLCCNAAARSAGNVHGRP